jgi:hypothetical protein
MSRQIDGVWNTDPGMDRVERQREAEAEARELTDSYGGVDNRGGHPNEVLAGSQPPSAGLRASSGESRPVNSICTGGQGALSVPPPASKASPPASPPVQILDPLPPFPNEPVHNALLGPWDGEL